MTATIKLKRKAIGAGWYRFDLLGGCHAGARFMSKNAWGYYFRGPNNEHLDINGQSGTEEYYGPSYDYALGRIREFVRGKLAGRNDKVLAVIDEAIRVGDATPAEAVYDALFKKGLLRLDAFEAR